VGLDSSPKRKYSKPKPTLFDGENPAVLVHAVLGHRIERQSRRLKKDTTTKLRKLLHEFITLATTQKA
jgi:hypothetical protein